MDFFATILFLVIYYIRPQEWVGFLLDRPLVQYSMIVALVGMVLRHRGLQFKDIFKTPHDWMMLFYFLWVVFSAPTFNPAFSDMRNLSLFYVVIVQALDSRAGLKKFVTIWTWMIFAVAALAVASEFGFDPMNSYDLTHGLAMKGRLCLNTSIFNNPNALAHGVAAALPMMYFTYIWHRPIFIKESVGLLIAIPAWCIYLTQSRGGYAAALGSFGTAMLFGRPRMLQILMIVGVMAVGPPAIRSIRYLERADDKGTEGSVEGRKMALRYGLSVMKANRFKGLGYRQFTQHSPWIIQVRRGRRIQTRRIAPHSAYNGIGAETGKMGLFLWLGVFYCSMKTLIIAKCKDEEDERLRRLLMSANLAFLFSSFFVDIGYRATFFITAGATAAFHRLVVMNQNKDTSVAAVAGAPPLAAAAAPAKPLADSEPAPDTAETTQPRIWNKIRILDAAGIFAVTLIVIKILEYMAARM